MKTKLLILLLALVPIIPTFLGCNETDLTGPTAEDQRTVISGDFSDPDNTRPQLRFKIEYYDPSGTILMGTTGIMAINLNNFPQENFIGQYGIPYTSCLVKFDLQWGDLPNRKFQINTFDKNIQLINKELSTAGTFTHSILLNTEGDVPHTYLEFKSQAILLKPVK